MMYDQIKQAADFIRAKISDQPKVGMILGSGLGELAQSIENPVVIPYSEIPHFAVSTAPGHKGQFVIGTYAGTPVICMQGRLHYYEGHSMDQMSLPIRVMKLLGVQILLTTNASGGINPSFSAGDFMLIEDHINFMGVNPLIGRNIPELGNRFFDMTYAYTPQLRTLASTCAEELGITLKKGVFLATTGPSFETPAEIRAFRLLGADAVGMSTVPEVITAAHCGLQVLAITLITNMAAGILDQPLTEEEVLEIGCQKSAELQSLMYAIVSKLGSEL